MSQADRFVFTSSTADAVWHPHKDPSAFEWWYFDAVSDDGNEAVVIVFLDNFLYSPRGQNGSADQKRPAVSFTYFSHGKVVYQTKSEVTPEQFSASTSEIKVRIGDSGFRLDSASYGSGYLVAVDLPLSRGRRLRGNFEWLAIESNLAQGSAPAAGAGHWWNLVAPRCDVSGKVTVEDPQRRTRNTVSFRGTGYHDHSLDNQWLEKALKDWYWGRAHFADATVVFYKYFEVGAAEPRSKLILARGDCLTTHDASTAYQGSTFDLHGIRYPKQLTFGSGAEIGLQVNAASIIDSNFFHLRFLSKIRLTIDGREREANGITEYIAPRTLRARWIKWLGELRGKRAQGSGPV